MRAESRTRPGNAVGFEVVEHTADWSLRIFGADMEQLLVQAALGMSSLLVSDLATLPVTLERQLELETFDAETLLVDWLSELAYLAEDEGFVFSEYRLSQVTYTHLSAVIRGGRPAELLKHIKAVTYHNLEIVRTSTGLTATVVFDV